MSGVVISPDDFGRGFSYYYSNFCFFYISDKEKIILIWILYIYLHIHIYILNLPIELKYTYWTSTNISLIIRSCCRVQTFWKSICLVKELFLVNSSIGVFWGILQVLRQLPCKTPFIFGFFPLYCQFFCYHLVVYYLTNLLEIM